MNLLVLEPLDVEVVEWLGKRHAVRVAPELARDPAALREGLQQVHGLILPPTVAVDHSLLKAAPRLRVIGRVSAGIETVDIEACRMHEVELVRSGAATGQAEAEYMLGAALNMLRRVPVYGADGLLVGRELGQSTVGLLGLTPASRVLAQILPAFGAKVLGYDPSLHESEDLWKQWNIPPVALRALMEQSDVLCVQLPFYPRYKGLLGHRVLGHAKANQVVVALTHCAMFDDVALAGAMRSGRILAAWMDSVEPGWLEPDRPLHGMPNLQITPRVASTTRESRVRAAWAVARRMDELLSKPETTAGAVAEPSGA